MGDKEAICELARRDGNLSDAEFQSGLAGEYDDPRYDGTLKTWNIETMCDGKALRAFANWGDVAPVLLKRTGDLEYRNEWMRTSWRFEKDSDGNAPTAHLTDSQGQTTTLSRIGPPREYEQ